MVVVVVVTVLVSTHSASSICSLEVRLDGVSLSSSHSIATVWPLGRGRRTSVVLVCMVAGVEAKGLGEASEEYLRNETELLLWTGAARLLETGRAGGSMMYAVLLRSCGVEMCVQGLCRPAPLF